MNDKKGKETGAPYSRFKKIKHYVIYLKSRLSSNEITQIKSLSIWLTKCAQNDLKATEMVREITIFLMYFTHYGQ